MDGEEGGGLRLSKRINDGEVDYKTKSGTAWSHSFLNQKPWHPLSYPNQRRKWIAEQIQNQRQRRNEEVSREYAQEQEFFRQAALLSKKEREKIETMKAVSFMYVRPPGYDPESAKAAELAESNKDGQEAQTDGASTSKQQPPEPELEAKKKPRPKDVFGRHLPTEQEFEVLKNAPRLETGLPTRSKPFGVEVRNVKCLRCGTFGHQSGDRECPLKDAVMPNEESRLKRDDPLTAILAHIDPSEPLKWELKQKPGMSPPRGGFRPDDPNQQIVADEEIFDEYGGFMDEDVIPQLLANFSSKPKKKSKKKIKLKKQSQSISGEDGSSSEDDRWMSKKKGSKLNRKKRNHSESSSSDIDIHQVNRGNESNLFEDMNPGNHRRSAKNRQKHPRSFGDSETDRPYVRDKSRDITTNASEDSEPDKNHRGGRSRRKQSYSSEDSDSEKHHRSAKNRQKYSLSYKDSEIDRHYRRDKNKKKGVKSSEDSEPDKNERGGRSRGKRSYSSEDSDQEKHHRSAKMRQKHSQGYRDSDIDRQYRRDKGRDSCTSSSEDSEPDRHHTSDKRRHRSRHQYSHSEDSEPDRHRSSDKRRHRSRHRYSHSEDSEPDLHRTSDKRRHRSRHQYSHSEDSEPDLHRTSDKRRYRGRHRQTS